ncbi:hypothetical protein KQ51_01309 [Candidatus Izimaplasma bacterium HR1]|jgi:hypothetical protein|uniref:hypothetical protein n=1 Tax=Candidatus Izimoplasma sp. HR1 TaxID=1541959 RepID=UPI0004F67A1B|nr:hypothetical protein KQ51_01309 [Candidatus Izimaplasma bacterium HR1]
MKTKEQFTNEMSRLGRIGIMITIILLFSVPTVFGLYHNAMPTFMDFLTAGVGLFAIYIPIGISEVLIYSPLLGSSSYITFITGNILNLKVPVANNAQELMDTTKGTEESDVITTLAIGVSSMVTIIILSLGVLLFVPLGPIMENDVIQEAANYVLPALFGALIISVLRPSGDVVIKNKLLSGVVPFILLIIVNIFVMNTTAYSGVILIVTVPITVGIAYLLFRKGKITIEPKEDK